MGKKQNSVLYIMCRLSLIYIYKSFAITTHLMRWDSVCCAWSHVRNISTIVVWCCQEFSFHITFCALTVPFDQVWMCGSPFVRCCLGRQRWNVRTLKKHTLLKIYAHTDNLHTCNVHCVCTIWVYVPAFHCVHPEQPPIHLSLSLSQTI